MEMGMMLGLWMGISVLMFALQGDGGVADAYEYKVGGLDAWAIPTGGRSALYQQWVANNTFKVGDSLLFLYPPSEDSVIQVTEGAYSRCAISNPIATFHDGNTVFKFNQWGYYYFTSGVPGHCQKYQKFAVIVLGANGALPPAPPPESYFDTAPAPAPAGNSVTATNSAPTMQPAAPLGFMIGLAFGLYALLF